MTHLINRSTLFDDLFRDVASGFYVKPLHGEALPKSVKVDVSDAGENYLIHAEIPGVSKEDIHVDIDGAKVSIKAEIKQQDSTSDDQRVLHSERYYGSVSRSFELPQDVDIEKSAAEYKNGVLQLTLPKKVQQESQRRLTIN